MAGDIPGSSFDVVALAGSAGGLAALNQVLPWLPDDFGAAVIIVQHLRGPESSLVEILGRRSPLPVQWIADRDPLEPGRVYVCPPQRLLEVRPDAGCSVRPMQPEHRLRPIDFFLDSLAGRYGRRAMAVVLTGMGRDGTAGSEAVSQAGGTVLVQSPESAEYRVMPSAVIEAGVADLVLPLTELGRAIADVIAGRAAAGPRVEPNAYGGNRASRKSGAGWERGPGERRIAEDQGRTP